MDVYLKQRWILTFTWVFFFIVVVVLVESYFHVVNMDNKVFLTPSDRTQSWEPIRNLYLPYIGGIVLFWFMQPFASPETDQGVRYRFILALFFTILFNIIIIYIIAQTYIVQRSDSNIIIDINFAVTYGGWFSFLVAPINAYYFGAKKKE